MKKHSELGYAIRNKWGFHSVLSNMRKDAIESHCNRVGEDWEALRKHGDRAVKVRMTEV